MPCSGLHGDGTEHPSPTRTPPRLGAVQSLAPRREPTGHREMPKPLAGLQGALLWDSSCQPPPLLGAEIGSQVQYTQPAPLPVWLAGKKLFLHRSLQWGCSRGPRQLGRARSRTELLPTPVHPRGWRGRVAWLVPNDPQQLLAPSHHSGDRARGWVRVENAPSKGLGRLGGKCHGILFFFVPFVCYCK